jgi:hypothetical protein
VIYEKFYLLVCNLLSRCFLQAYSSAMKLEAASCSKTLTFNGLHSVISQKAELIAIAARISNLAHVVYCCKILCTLPHSIVAFPSDYLFIKTLYQTSFESSEVEPSTDL